VLSIVIPVYNEEKVLPRTLSALLAEPGDHEIMVVDGGSHDTTLDIARSEPRVRLITAPKGRALQMNAGARAAQGHLLLFLHADTQLPSGAIARLAALDESVQAGAFRHRFTPDDWQLRLISAGDNLRCRITRIYYGDQALFVRASLFHALGGFPEVSMLEDVMFCERLRRVTKPVLLREAVRTDARRFIEHGRWRSVYFALVILARHKLGLPLRGRGYSEEVR
jgi:rSAM/selenodomain-associated transferase 2